VGSHFEPETLSVTGERMGMDGSAGVVILFKNKGIESRFCAVMSETQPADPCADNDYTIFHGFSPSGENVLMIVAEFSENVSPEPPRAG
jgi:hypothetical protein